MVHGLQLFVNLSAANKTLPPQAFYLDTASVPVVEEDGHRVRILSGSYGAQKSPIDHVEEFDFFDIKLENSFDYRVRSGWNAILYVVSGSVRAFATGQEREVDVNQAVAARALGEGGMLKVVAQGPAQILFLAGRDHKEPVVAYGPFIMNDQKQIEAALERHRTGGMGSIR
jgi:redox-sensitive bicupin YhaK (pirin superfamily)